MKRLLSIISALFICVLMVGSLSAAAPVSTPPPVVGPNGKPAQTPTFDGPITCHQVVPKGAILGAHVTYPDPDTCSEPVPANGPKNLVNTYSKSAMKQFTDFDTRMISKLDGKFSASSSYSYDDYWGYAYGASQVLRSGILAQVSAVVPTYSVGSRAVRFQNAFKPAQYSCLAAGVEHTRNDVPDGNYDYFIWWNVCAGGARAYVWNFIDPTVQSWYVRNDVFGSPFMNMDVEQTTTVNNCFAGEAFNYSTGVWNTTITVCDRGTTQSGYFNENAFNLASPTPICPSALNPYMYTVYKRVGLSWSEITAADLTANNGGACTPTPYHPDFTVLQGHSTIIFYQS